MSETIDQRIAELEDELAALRRTKLSELQSQIAILQASLSAGGETSSVRLGFSPGSGAAGISRRRGRPPKSESKGGAEAGGAATPRTGRKSRGRKRGKRIAEADALAMITKVVEDGGSEGISALTASQLAGVSYPRARQLMARKFKKSGSGKWTRYRVK